MVDSPGSSIPLPPADLVGKRIDERRLFEAQFFFNKFSSEIDSPVREQLDQQLTTRILLAKQVFTKGEYLEQAGELEKAMTVYAELAEIAVDYPSLSQALQRIEVAIKLGSLQQDRPGPVEPATEKLIPEISPLVTPLTGTNPPVSKALSYVQQNKIPMVIVCVLFAVLAFIAGLLLFRSREGVEVAKGIQSITVPPKRDEAAIVSPLIQPVPQPVVPIELPAVGSSSTGLPVQPAVPVVKTREVERQDDSNSLNIKGITVEKDMMPSPQLIVADESDRKQAVSEQKKSRLRISKNILMVQ